MERMETEEAELSVKDEEVENAKDQNLSSHAQTL